MITGGLYHNGVGVGDGEFRMLSGPGGFLLTSGIDPLTSLKEICLAGTVNGLRKNEHAPGYVFAQ